MSLALDILRRHRDEQMSLVCADGIAEDLSLSAVKLAGFLDAIISEIEEAEKRNG